MKNVLKYSIRDEVLYGSLGGVSYSMTAYSGGGRGSTAGMERRDLDHWRTQKKAPDSFSAATGAPRCRSACTWSSTSASTSISGAARS